MTEAVQTRQNLMRSEIRNAATRLFSRKGIKGVTLRDVAAEVGLSKAGIYHYFDNKESLVAYLFGDWAEESVKPFRELSESSLDPVTKVRRAIELRVEQTVSDPELFALSIGEENNLPEDVRVKFRQSKRLADHLVREMIEEGQAQGVFVSVDAHVAEFALMGMCNWLFRWYNPAGSQSPASVAETFSRIFLHGLSAAEASPSPDSLPIEGLSIEDHLAIIQRHLQAVGKQFASKSSERGVPWPYSPPRGRSWSPAEGERGADL
jgi:TetR/AcrR family transcriptional regulator, cholesterol catabolism regulator